MSEQRRECAFLLPKIFIQKYFLLFFNLIKISINVLHFFLLYYPNDNEKQRELQTEWRVSPPCLLNWQFMENTSEFTMYFTIISACMVYLGNLLMSTRVFSRREHSLQLSWKHKHQGNINQSLRLFCLETLKQIRIKIRGLHEPNFMIWYLLNTWNDLIHCTLQYSTSLGVVETWGGVQPEIRARSHTQKEVQEGCMEPTFIHTSR